MIMMLFTSNTLREIRRSIATLPFRQIMVEQERDFMFEQVRVQKYERREASMKITLVTLDSTSYIQHPTYNIQRHDNNMNCEKR